MGLRQDTGKDSCVTVSTVSIGDLFVITNIGPSGSVNLMQTQDSAMRVQVTGELFPGDWVIPIEQEFIRGAGAPYVKILTRCGVGYVSNFIFARATTRQELQPSEPFEPR
jgi:hypothetical protein